MTTLKPNTSVEATELGIKMMQETIKKKNSIDHKEGTFPSLKDLQKDPKWVELFNAGYIFVMNLATTELEAIKKRKSTNVKPKEAGRRDLLEIYDNNPYFQDGVEHKTATAYEYGNPAKRTLKSFGFDNTVALFAKVPEKSALDKAPATT